MLQRREDRRPLPQPSITRSQDIPTSSSIYGLPPTNVGGVMMGTDTSAMGNVVEAENAAGIGNGQRGGNAVEVTNEGTFEESGGAVSGGFGFVFQFGDYDPKKMNRENKNVQILTGKPIASSGTVDGGDWLSQTLILESQVLESGLWQ